MRSTDSDNIRLDWVAGIFGILVGLTMANVPWEFGAPAFQIIYPRLTTLGATFLVSGALLAASALYPAWPRPLTWMARASFLLTLGVYWWTVAVLSAGPTGTIVYPLMAAGLLLEMSPRFRERSAFVPFITLVGLGFGVGMFIRPDAFVSGIYARLHALLPWVGALYITGSLLLAFGRWRGKRSAACAGGLLLAALFAQASWTAFSARSWTGSELYAILGLGCALHALQLRLPRASSIRFRFLRVLVMACVLPLLGLGTLAALIAQRAVKDQVRVNAQQAALAESQGLAIRLAELNAVLTVHAQDLSFLQQVATLDAPALEARLRQLVATSPVADRMYVLDRDGTRLAGGPAPAVHGNFSEREYFREAIRRSGVYISKPMMGRLGHPSVVLAVKLELGGERVGVLCAVMLLESINRQLSFTSDRYAVEVVDERDLGIVRKAGAAPALEHSVHPAHIIRGPDAFYEHFSPEGRLHLVSLASVPASPWKVVVAAPLKDAYAPLSRLTFAVIGFALLASLLAVLIARVGARELLASVERLRHAFSRVTQVEQQPLGAQTDELGQLEGAFHGMAADIERQRQELQAAVATREQFLSMASHELRTPLAALSMTVDAIGLRQEPSPKNVRAVERMRKQISRLDRLISDLLDVSRLQTGRFALTFAPAEGVTLVRETIERLRLVHPGHAERLSLSLPEFGVSANWDEQRVEQLLTNLVENAFRYSPEGTPVRVVMEASDDRVRVSVTDQGIGIPEDSLPQLFKSYYRAPNASSAHAGGLGLGLVISREIAERHGGRLWAESPGVNLGSSFHFELPIQGRQLEDVRSTGGAA